MDTETIRQVIAAFKDLGGDAKEAFVWYLILAHVPDFIIGIVWATGVLLILAKVVSFLRMIFVQFSGLCALYAATGKSLVSDDWKRAEWDRAIELIRKHWNEPAK